MTLQMSIWKFTFSNINTPETSCSILLEGWINAIHWINLYKLDGIIGFPNSYLLDSDLSGGQGYPTFKQPEPEHYFILSNT